MGNQGSVCIVVVNYNGLEISRECIDSLLALEYKSFCVAFVDNGSTNGSGRIIDAEYSGRIVFIALPVNLGVTGGNNAGINYAVKHDYDYVLFLNNDTVVEPKFLDSLVHTSKEYGNALVVPKIICYFDRKRLDHYIGTDVDWWTSQPQGYSPYPLDSPELNIGCEIKVASTCCLLVPASGFADFGVMDEEYFMYQDDSDFTLRATRAGYRMFYEPEAIIYHKCNTTTRDKQFSYFELYLQFRNVFYFYNKLCDKPLIKIAFFAKTVLTLLLMYVLAALKNNQNKRRIIALIFKHVAIKKMGIPNLEHG